MHRCYNDPQLLQVLGLIQHPSPREQNKMDIFINKNLYLYNNKLCNVYYLFSNIFLLIGIQIKYY